MNKKKIDNKTLAQAYVDCGKVAGYFMAESILMKYLPSTKPDGKCFNVPQRNRPAMIAELKKHSKEKK